MKNVRILFLIVIVVILACMLCSCDNPSKNFFNASIGLCCELPEDSDDENFDDVVENAFINTTDNAISTFKLDSSTANYQITRANINNNDKPDADYVRIEEYINYFNYSSYNEPNENEAVGLTSYMMDCPWNSENKLLSLGLKTEEVSVPTLANNIVFLIDISGSMFGSDRLGLIQESFNILASNLNANDTISIVSYANGTDVVLDGAKGNEKTKIIDSINSLNASGGTNGGSGLSLAYLVAERYKIPSGNNRVILATDGDFNLGETDDNALNSMISRKRETGIYLSVYGVGMGNTNDSLMRNLAENGNGNYGFLDSLLEARKSFVDELGGTLRTVAKDAKAQVVFSSAVEKYRLIGYENKMLTIEQFDNENTDSGEIGSGLTVTALYEVKLSSEVNDDIATFTVRYKTPDTNESKEISLTPQRQLLDVAPCEDAIFISCVAEFGLLLKNSLYKGNSSFDSIITRLNTLSEIENDVYKTDFKILVNKAKILYI